ncbi:MAG: methyltransferase [Bacilli bacterium]|nr:methyltransferase [Bacilli bacterium]
MNLTSRQRVRLALEHKEADRVPIDFGAMRSTGISAIAYHKVKKYLGIETGHTKLYDIYQQLAEPEPMMLDYFHADVVQLHRLKPAFGVDILNWKAGVLPDGSECLVPLNFSPIEDENGDLIIMNGDIPMAKMPKGGLYFDKLYQPFKDCKTIEDIDRIPMPIISDEELDYLEKEAKRLYETTDKAILGTFGGNIIEKGESDWGFELFMMNLAMRKDLIHHYLKRLSTSHMINLEKYLSRVGKYIDVIQFGDDLGSQTNTLISVSMYREMIKPYHKMQYQWVQKNYPDVKVFLHSCGSIVKLIPDLIDAGVQVLNPIQLSATGMDPEFLKNEYGKDLVFWGGGIDTQQTLTHCKVEDIPSEVKRLIDIFKKDGGFVFTQVHNIQANIPPEKVVCVYESAYKYGSYDK